MKNFMEHNLNEYIYVKLKEEGREIYKNRLNNGMDYPGKKEYANKVLKKIKVGKWTKFQFHEFIGIFGKYIGMGRNLPIETTFRIEYETR